MNKKIMSSLLFMLLCAASAGAEVSGNVDLTGTMLGTSGNRSKMNEYRDLGNGFNLGFGLDVSQDQLYLNLRGENFRFNEETRKDNQEIDFSIVGGKYDSHKLSLYYNQIPHNLTLGAKTYYSGIGTNNLTGAIENAAPATWNNRFDYKRDRTNFGAGLDISLKSPYFFGVKYDRTDVKGLAPTGNRVSATLGGSTFFSEFPSPIDYKTDNVSLEAGYRSKDIIFKVDALISQFSNPDQTMTIPGLLNAGGTAGGAGAPISLPPNNDYYKVGGSLMVHLPLNSTLMARANHSILENTIDLNQFLVGTPSYHGRVTYTTASLSVTSNPIKMLETRVFYNLLDKQNHSTGSFNYSGNITEKFAYHKQNVGVDLAVKLPAKTKVSTGYEFLHLNRALSEEAASTTDHTVYVEAKNSALDMLTAKIRLQHLKRLSDNNVVFINSASANLRKFDRTDKTQEAIKFGLEIEPLHNLSVGMEYAYKLNLYDKTVFGIKSDNRHEFNFDTNYMIANVKLNAFFDYQFSNSKYFTYTGVYGYNNKIENRSYDYGFNVDVDIIKNVLTAGAGWRFDRSNGSMDFSSNRVVGGELLDIPAVDDYTRQTLTTKLGYNVTKNVGVSCGYSYERLNYSDASINGYQNRVLTGAGLRTGYLTGAYADPNYEAHIGFMKLAYTF